MKNQMEELMGMEDFLQLPGTRGSRLFIRKFNNKYEPFILEMPRSGDTQPYVARLLYPMFPSSVCDAPLSFAQDIWAKEMVGSIVGIKDHYVCEWHIMTADAMKKLLTLFEKETTLHTLWFSSEPQEQIFLYRNKQAISRSFQIMLTLPDSVVHPLWEKKVLLYIVEKQDDITVDIKGYPLQKMYNTPFSVLPYLRENASEIFPFLKYVDTNVVSGKQFGLFFRSLTVSISSVCIEPIRMYGNIVYSDIPYQFDRYVSLLNFDFIGNIKNNII